MSLYEFNAALIHYNRIQKGKGPSMSDADFDAGLDKIRALGMKDVRI